MGKARIRHARFSLTTVGVFAIYKIVVAILEIVRAYVLPIFTERFLGVRFPTAEGAVNSTDAVTTVLGWVLALLLLFLYVLLLVCCIVPSMKRDSKRQFYLCCMAVFFALEVLDLFVLRLWGWANFGFTALELVPILGGFLILRSCLKELEAQSAPPAALGPQQG